MTLFARLWFALAAIARPRPDTLPTDDARTTGVLELLGLLEREGRLLGFIMEPIEEYTDEEVGAAARVVAAGTRKALLARLAIERVRGEPEGRADRGGR